MPDTVESLAAFATFVASLARWDNAASQTSSVEPNPIQSTGHVEAWGAVSDLYGGQVDGPTPVVTSIPALAVVRRPGAALLVVIAGAAGLRGSRGGGLG